MALPNKETLEFYDKIFDWLTKKDRDNDNKIVYTFSKDVPKEKEYAYARISRKTQKIERQIENLTKAYPNARIYQEAYTGTRTEGRKEFRKMLSVVKPGHYYL